MRTLLAAASIALAIALPMSTSAHQPSIVDDNLVTVRSPEVSRAYYGELAGVPVRFEIESDSPFRLYVGILVPQQDGIRTDWQVYVTRDGEPVASLDGSEAEWGEFHEEFAGDDYLKGPEYSAEVAPGSYEVVVNNPDSSGKFVLAVGDREVWGVGSTIDSLRVIPRLKTNFFGHATAPGFLFSVFGAASFILSVVIGLTFGMAAKRLWAWLSKRQAGPNLGRFGRSSRFFAGVVLIAAGLAWWCLALIAVGTFLVYEGLSGWCFLMAAAQGNKNKEQADV